jgi:mannose-6-phosphate isomerase-like protein (cupin superfamily)
MRRTSKETAEHYVWGRRCDGWRLVDQPGLSVIQERIPPGSGEVQHHHAQARQFFFVLSGEATFVVDGARQTVGAQQGIEIPPGAVHAVINETSSPIEFLTISAPTTRGDRVEARRVTR